MFLYTRGPLHKTLAGEKTLAKSENSVKVELQRKLQLCTNYILCLCQKLGDDKYVRLLLITHRGMLKEQRENSSAMRALRRNSGKFGDVFTDVMKCTNLTVADDCHS